MAKTKRKFNATEEGQEKKAEQPSDEDHKKIICPLTLAATTKINRKPLAVNYTCTPETTMELDECGKPGGWYSSPKGRNHEQAFIKELDRRKALPKDDPEFIDWTNDGEVADVDGYYFSQEEGEKAREKYERMVLDGQTTLEDGTVIEVKGNAKSWRNKHAGFTGVTWEEVQARHPDLYKTSTTSKKEEKAAEDDAAERMVDAAEEIEAEIDEVPLTQEQVQAEEAMAEEEEISAELVDAIEAEEEEAEDEIEEIEA